VATAIKSESPWGAKWEALTPLHRTVLAHSIELCGELGVVAGEMEEVLNSVSRDEPLDPGKVRCALEDIEMHYKMIADAVEAVLEVSEVAA